MKFQSLFALLFLVVAFNVEAAPVKKVLISVGDFKENDKKEWKRETCLEVYTIANQIADVNKGVDIVCREFDTSNMIDEKLKGLSTKFDYHLRITRSQNGAVDMDAYNWSKKSDSDFRSVGWKFKDGTGKGATKEEAFSKIVGNFFLYTANEQAYKAALLINGIKESEQIDFNTKTGQFVDKATNLPIPLETAYSLYENESPRKRNYLRAGIEIGVQLSAALAIYYRNLVFNSVDFDYTLTGGLKAKYITGEALKFDDNDKQSNYGHIYAGVMYYQTARSNGFTSLESAIITFASSAAWETLEYHEVFSLNDQILTPVGGYVIGEATYQITCALLAKDSLAAKALGYTINPNMALNHGIDRLKNQPHATNADCTKPRWSDISVYVGLEKGQKSYEPSANNDFAFGMKAEVINLDKYGKEGKESKLVLDTSIARMNVDVNGNDKLMDLKVLAQVVMAAYRKKDMDRDQKGELRGYDIAIGLSTASTWTDRGSEELSKDEDFYGTINLLGATAHANVFYKGYNIRADFGMYGDFAMVKSYSLEGYKATKGGDLSDESSVIKRKGYYWGTGSTALAGISASKGRFQVGYEGQNSQASSIDKRNRIKIQSS
ncbi:MAG: DUF3943 domain-containing protein [Bdellovibrionales bacterium]|nr:DUF3943 domain-containing protein [Bdellovibrionales bacterium]